MTWSVQIDFSEILEVVNVTLGGFQIYILYWRENDF